MSPAQPLGKKRPSRTAAKWRQVLNLGRQLLDLGQELHQQSSTSPTFNQTLTQSLFTEQRDLIVDTASRLLKGSAQLWLAEDLLSFPKAGSTGNAASGFEAERSAPEPPSNLMRQARASRHMVCGLSAAQPVERPDSADLHAMAIPLTLEAETKASTVMGVLQIERAVGPAFSQDELELFDGLALQVTIALQADRQTAIERWRIEQLSLVRQVSAQIADVRGIRELARQITRLILETFDYYYVAIFTLEPGEDILHYRDSAGPQDSSETFSEPARSDHLPPFVTIHIGEGIIGTVAQTGQELLASDVSLEARYRYTDGLPETRSEFALPLKIKTRVVGVLDVQSNLLDDFHEMDRLVLRALAGNIAVAVEDARLYTALRQRAEQLSAISEVSNAITCILDLEDLLSEVVRLIQKRFGFPYIHIFDVHPGRKKIIYQAGSGPRSKALQEQGFAYDLEDPQGIIPWVVRHGETLLVNNVEEEPRYRPSPLPPEDTRSELDVPMIFNGQVLGVLDVQSDQLNAFSTEDRFLFEALADDIAIALRNATLYRSEAWRRQVAESLREVAGLLSADVDVDQVLRAILTELDRTLPCDAAAIWLLDVETSETASADASQALRLAAVYGEASTGLARHYGHNLREIYLENGSAGTYASDSQIAGWLSEALNGEQPIIRSAQSPFDPLGLALDFPEDYSAIAAPLHVGDQHLGVLTLAHRSPGRYGAESRLMTAAFASYASVAIENTRLYEAAHEQAWVSTVLLQVSEATQTLTNLNELLATVVRITPMLVGVKACAVYMLDENNVFVPASAYGLNKEQQTEFERWRFAPGDIPALDRLLTQQHSLILRTEDSDPFFSNILFSSQDEEAAGGADLLILVPLLAHAEVTGALLIDYRSDQPGWDDQEALEALFDERLAILQGIAHQTAVAVENIRLLKAQKEEAYVSVALLQVAQAVVSSNDLDEALGSIVRITPILVGVKRSLIYLWDAESQQFHLSQSYGIPRLAAERTYSPAEFPLLEAVRQWDMLMAHPLSEEDNYPSPPESWARIVPADLDEIDEYLESSLRLLLAFPLSVKGTVLGVLLVEEPEPAPVEAFAGGGVPRRLREKRLEITKGISQQAALAIQNDQLQKETVERERLEREFQLAREIQRTFLPHELLHPPGWDMNVLWRTAREVGGDFYDFFELPGNRLGFVIADVADKGMPAALFMTLIRTLVRATVQGIDSPAAVLERVNDVLVPDAQRGMFVTIFYAVLQVEAGHMVYANAGHNPPLIVRAEDSQILALEKSGMALGVLEGNLLEQRSVTLQPGDSLICYTDGLTEAFSSTGDMFSEARLRETLKAYFADRERARNSSAQEILDAIEATLNDFIGAESISDDLTMLVLKRSPSL